MTFVVELVAFIIVLGVLWKWVIPPLQKAMNDRQETIRKQLAESEAAKEALQKAEAEYKNAVADARREAAQMRSEAEDQRKAIVERASSEAEQKVNEILARGQAQLEAEQRQAVRQLKAELGGLAIELASKIVGESLNDDQRQERVIERFLGDLDQPDAAEQPEEADAGR
jgi:F-type H+-transporting ATPase subunit b